MKKLIILCAVALLVTVIGCSDGSDTILGDNSADQVQSVERDVSAKASETGYAEKKVQEPEPVTGP